MIFAGNKVARFSIEATVTRTNGRVEDLGTITYWHKNPLKRLWFRIRSYVNGITRH